MAARESALLLAVVVASRGFSWCWDWETGSERVLWFVNQRHRKFSIGISHMLDLIRNLVLIIHVISYTNLNILI